MVNPILSIIIVLVLYLTLDTIGKRRNIPYLPYIAILMWFLFSFVNLETNIATAMFYSISTLLIIGIEASKSLGSLKAEQVQEIGKFRFIGKIPYLSIALGFGIFFVMRSLQVSSAGAIIGVPSLALTSADATIITAMLIGIVETRLFLTLWVLLKDNIQYVLALPFVGQVGRFILPVFPLIILSLFFSIFHRTAFSSSVSTMFYAFVVMAIWILTFQLTKDDTAPNFSHALWNGLVMSSRLSLIAF